MFRVRGLLLGVVIAGVVAPASAGAAPVTPSGWRIDPAGVEIGVSKTVGGFQGPLGSALSPDGTRLLTVSSGAARMDSADLFDLDQRTRQDSVPYDADTGQSVFYGTVFSPDGTRAWASGGGQNVIHQYAVTPSGLDETGQIAAPFFPAGMAYGHTPKGDRIYVANNLAADTSGANPNPPGHQVTVIDPSTGAVTGTIDLGSALAPLGVTFSHDGGRAFVTNWLGRSVSVIDTGSEQKIGDIQLSPQANPLQADHPSAIAANPQRDEVYTANSNSDTVSVIDTGADALAATIDVSLVHGPNKGAIPDGLAVSHDGKTLYVTEAGENAVAVVDLDSRSVKGFIPTSWYPADVKVTPDDKRIVVTNTNDSGAGPNTCGPTAPQAGCPPPDPTVDEVGRGIKDSQYTGSMIKGSVSVIQVPTASELADLTDQVERNSQAHVRRTPMPRAASAINHVIYVIKENRTYDQVFGNLSKGNGDPRLNLFKDDSAPNIRTLARRFVTLDNFYADAEVSADGHNWSTQASATDYVDKTWPINYSPGLRSRQRSYDFEDVPLARQFPTEPLAGDPSLARSAAAQTRGYLWDNAYEHGVSFRDYGEFTSSSNPCGGVPNTSSTTHLQPQFGTVDTNFPSYSLACSDHTQREPEWQREFDAYVQNGNLPSLEIVRLGNDHTQGTRPGAATPESYVADNDLAVGNLVDAVSHSPYWKSTLILITEDDAQNGPDHVDAHRTEALAVSPYTQTGKVDSTQYDTASMVATAEDLLGLPPMSIVDARVNRLWNSFTGKPDTTSYEAKQPDVVPFGDPGAPVNAATAPMAATASRWNFVKEDRAPEIALNRSIWKSVRGRKSRMPQPRHVHIVGSRPTDQDG